MINPRRIAFMTASVRLLAPSLWKIRLRWLRTVFWLIPKRLPICLLDLPAATYERTLSSRLETSGLRAAPPGPWKRRTRVFAKRPHRR